MLASWEMGVEIDWKWHEELFWGTEMSFPVLSRVGLVATRVY